MNFVEECFEMLQYIEKGNKLKWSYFPKVGNTVMFYLSAVLNYLDVGGIIHVLTLKTADTP